MWENNITELEEGEASCYFKDEDENFDPDSFNYIDEKLEQVLGHFKKDFEGEVIAENLGSKYGGYGSFLPTYEWSPPVLSTPKTPQRNCNTSRSPKSLTEGASQNSIASSNAPQTVRLGTTSSSAHLSHRSRLGSVTDNHDSCFPSTQVAERCPMKVHTSSRSGNLTDQRTLKVRIKMNSNSTAQKNVALYDGLGLNSPSSSFGNSPEEIGEMPLPSQATPDESPTNIIQVMSSFPVSGDVPISPLHDSLIQLAMKKKLYQQKMALPSKGHHKHSSLSVEDSASTWGNRDVLKVPKIEGTSNAETQVELKIENVIHLKNDMKILIKKKSESDTVGGKELLSNGFKATRLSNSVDDVGACLKDMCRAPKDFRLSNENEVKGRLHSSALAKEESLDSISGHGCVKNEKRSSKCDSVEKVLKQSVKNPLKDVSLKPRGEGRRKDYKVLDSVDYSGASTCKEELDILKQNAAKEGSYPDPENTNVTVKKENVSFEAKAKSKGKLSNGKLVRVLKKESLVDEMGEVPKDKLIGGHGVLLSGRKMPTSKSQRDTLKHNHRDSLGGKKLKQRDRIAVAERSSDDSDLEWKISMKKTNEKLNHRKMSNRLMLGASDKEVPITPTLAMEDGLASEIVPVATAPTLINEDWVACDSCLKWRLLPFGRKPDQLPEKWLCSMLDWLGPGMNRCDISEEETTKALNALYQPPPSQSLVNPQNDVNGALSVIPLGHAQHLDQNDQNLSSNGISKRGKKKHGVRETPNAGSGSGLLNSYLQEPVKCTSLNDMSQPPLESNGMKKSSLQHMSKLQNLCLEENILRQKEEQTIGGDAMKVRLKQKKETDHYTSGTPKKPKRADMLHADKTLSPDLNLGKVGRTISNGLGTLASEHDGKYNESCYFDDTKDEANDKVQVSANKEENQTKASLDGRLLDVRPCSKWDSSMKKRKMKERQDNQNDVETCQNFVQRGRGYTKEESSESGSRKEKKSRILKSDGKDSSTSNGDNKSDRKTRVTKIILSGKKAHGNDALKKDTSAVNDRQLGYNIERNAASQKTLEGVNALKRDLGPENVSLAATSSSSKVSGSRKSRGNFEDVKGSPVESVSSSPLRTSNSGRLTSMGDVFGKDESVRCGFSLTNNSTRCSDGDGNGSDRLGTTRKVKISGCSRLESHKSSRVSYRHVGANDESSVKGKPDSEVWNTHLPSGNNATIEQHGQSPGNQHGRYHCHEDTRESKNLPDCKDVVRGSTYDLAGDKINISGRMNEHAKTNQRCASEIASNHNDRNNLPEECSIKPAKVKEENYHVSRWDDVRHISSFGGVGSHIKRKDYDVSDAKIDVTQIPNTKGVLPQNMVEDPECGQPKLSSYSQSEGKEGGVRKEGPRSLGAGCMEGSDREDVFQGLPVSSAVNGDVPRSLKQCGTVTNKKESNCNVVHLMPDQVGAKDVSGSSPVISSSGQIATKILNEAKRLRDTAEQLKNSGFSLESYETFSQAGLKFLQGAALFDSCGGEKGKHGDMTPLQVYSTTAKLFESCAHEYERRKEMSSAALAYKCMEVAYMRIVYCKHSYTNRDRHELQAALNMAPQGESPSSSASDIDNLNNQVMAEKAILSKGTGSHVGGNHVVVARNRSHFVRLLDFTQDVGYAMEASRKSQSAFSAALLCLKDAHNSDCISSIRRVIDFSFHDVNELVRLVQIAREAIVRSNFGGARD